VRFDGHAIEVRLCAESPVDEFLPGSGTVLDWSVPATIRCDHALSIGAVIPAWYDSMVAKLVVHAATRDECIEQLADALDRTVLLGVPGNRAFLAQALRHAGFRAGRDVSTAFIERHFAEPGSRAAPPDARTWALAAWLSIAGAPEAACTPAEWRHWGTGRPLPQPWALHWRAPAAYAAATRTMRGRLYLTPCSARIEHESGLHTVVGVSAGAGCNGHAEVDGERCDYRYAWSAATLWLHTPHGDYAFQNTRREPVRSGPSAAASAAAVCATINGRVLEVLATPGATVAQGDRLVVLEAMKMEHEVRAARTGVIAHVGVATGDQVVPGQLLVRYEGEAA
jgi:geranyl-CoA carboxylase alpha subunit